MFKEFTRCSWRGFGIALFAGIGVLMVAAVAAVLVGSPLVLQTGLVVALVGARLAEAGFSHNCSWSKAGVDSAVLAMGGVLLIAADELASTVI